MVCERVHATWIPYFGVAIHISEWQYIFRCGNTYFRVAIHISERQYIFQSGITYFRGGGMHTVRTRWGHGENGKLELYEDGELGTRPGRTRYRHGIDRYDKWKTIWPVRPHGRVTASYGTLQKVDGGMNYFTSWWIFLLFAAEITTALRKSLPKPMLTFSFATVENITSLTFDSVCNVNFCSNSKKLTAVSYSFTSVICDQMKT